MNDNTYLQPSSSSTSFNTHNTFPPFRFSVATLTRSFPSSPSSTASCPGFGGVCGSANNKSPWSMPLSFNLSVAMYCHLYQYSAKSIILNLKYRPSKCIKSLSIVNNSRSYTEAVAAIHKSFLPMFRALNATWLPSSLPWL